MKKCARSASAQKEQNGAKRSNEERVNAKFFSWTPDQLNSYNEQRRWVAAGSQLGADRTDTPSLFALLILCLVAMALCLVPCATKSVRPSTVFLRF